jgi:hypothetical protein
MNNISNYFYGLKYVTFSSCFIVNKSQRIVEFKKLSTHLLHQLTESPPYPTQVTYIYLSILATVLRLYKFVVLSHRILMSRVLIISIMSCLI